MLSSIFAAIAAVGKLIDLIVIGIKTFIAWLLQHKLEMKVEDAKKAEAELSQANLIADDQLRLAAKAKAADDLKKSLGRK